MFVCLFVSRVIPVKERHAVATFLHDILDCNADSLPTESLIHRFWFLFSHFHTGLKDYTKCLKMNKIKYSV